MAFTYKARQFSIQLDDIPQVMGILNATPDSFSDGGLITPDSIYHAAQAQHSEGAAIVDIGAESTRPGASEVDASEELQRLNPLLKHLKHTPAPFPLSIDTYKAPVAKAALEAGFAMVNDIWGLRQDPEIAEVVADYQAGIVLMHNSRDTQHSDKLIDEVLDSLKSSIDIALSAGISQQSIMIDPGIGFGKSPAQSLQVLKHLNRFHELGFPVLLGASRKSVIGETLQLPVDQRIEGTLATTALAASAELAMVRVHDVTANARLLKMLAAVRQA